MARDDFASQQLVFEMLIQCLKDWWPAKLSLSIPILLKLWFDPMYDPMPSCFNTSRTQKETAFDCIFRILRITTRMGDCLLEKTALNDDEESGEWAINSLLFLCLNFIQQAAIVAAIMLTCYKFVSFLWIKMWNQHWLLTTLLWSSICGVHLLILFIKATVLSYMQVKCCWCWGSSVYHPESFWSLCGLRLGFLK